MIAWLLLIPVVFSAGFLAGCEYHWRFARRTATVITLRDNDGVTPARSTYARRDEWPGS